MAKLLVKRGKERSGGETREGGGRDASRVGGATRRARETRVRGREGDGRDGGGGIGDARGV